MSFLLCNELAAALFCAVMGAFAFFHNPTNPANRNFALFNLAMAAWIPSDLIKFIPSHPEALTAYRLIYVGGSFITFTFIRFMWSIAGKKGSWIYEAIKWLALMFALLSQTGLMIKDIQFLPTESGPIQEIHGPFYPAFIIFFVLSLSYSVTPLILDYHHSNGTRRKQFQYIMIAIGFGFIAVLNFFGNLSNSHIPPLFYFFIMAISATFATAILKHQLMDIRIIVRNTVVYSFVTGALTILMVLVALTVAHLTEGFLGHKTFVASAIAACFIMALFHPVQLKIQDFLDRYLFPGWKDRELAREIADGFSHELKSPLAKLSLQAQLALADVQDIRSGKRDTKDLVKVEKDLARLVAQTMEAASRVEAVRGLAEPAADQVESVDIASVIESCLHGLRLIMQQANVIVDKNIPINLQPVKSNAKQLEIVFTNLMKNGIDAMRMLSAGRMRTLSVKAWEENGLTVVSIRDNGIGIDSDNRSKLFLPYFTTKGSKGTGMGLYLSKQIITAYSGTIEVISDAGQGTEFILKLPNID
jgi:signal transduction histidine kinase